MSGKAANFLKGVVLPLAPPFMVGLMLTLGWCPTGQICGQSLCAITWTFILLYLMHFAYWMSIRYCTPVAKQPVLQKHRTWLMFMLAVTLVFLIAGNYSMYMVRNYEQPNCNATIETVGISHQCFPCYDFKNPYVRFTLISMEMMGIIMLVLNCLMLRSVGKTMAQLRDCDQADQQTSGRLLSVRERVQMAEV